MPAARQRHFEQANYRWTLVRHIHSHGPRQSIVSAVCDACLDLDIDVLAEGMECFEERAFPQSRHIELFQGYYFAKPGFECLPPATFPARDSF